MTDKLLPAEKGIREFFGKKYMWLLDHNGKLTLQPIRKPDRKKTT